MTALTFHPWAALKRKREDATPAKVANPANPNPAQPSQISGFSRFSRGAAPYA